MHIANTTRKGVLFFALVATLFGSSVLAKPPAPPPPIVAPYTIEFLGTLGGTRLTSPYGINNHGDVVGMADSGILIPAATETWYHAFLNVDDGDGNRVMIDLQDRFEDEGLIAPFNYQTGSGFQITSASDINDAGQILLKGAQYGPGWSARTIFRYTPGSIDEFGGLIPPRLNRCNTWISISSSQWISSRYPHDLEAINDSGVCAGTALYNSDENQRHVSVWTGETGYGQTVDLGQLNGKSTTALDLNDSGQLCGYATGSNAWRYTVGVGFENLGTLRNNSTTTASSLNNSGQVTGTCTLSNFTFRAFRYTDGLGMEDIGTLGGANNLGGDSINNYGDVVGRAQNSKGYMRLYLFTDTLGMIDLETQITNRAAPAKSGDFEKARVNDNGHVCGYSQSQGAFLLTPVNPLPR